MKVLALCGSPSPDSATARVLRALARMSRPDHAWTHVEGIGAWPLFTPERLRAGRPNEIQVLAEAAAEAELVVVATPEYAHNVPAALKSALEWLVASGELSGKPAIAVTSTPHAPRGEHAMRSLVATLLAMDARVLAEVPVYGVAAGAIEASTLEVVDGKLRELLAATLEVGGLV